MLPNLVEEILVVLKLAPSGVSNTSLVGKYVNFTNTSMHGLIFKTRM